MTFRSARGIIAAPETLSRRWRMRLSRAIDEFLRDTRAAGKAKATIDGYSSDLHGLSGLASLAGHAGRHDTILQVTPDLIRRYFISLSESNLKLSTLHRKAACVREFIRWGRRQRLWTSTEDLLDAVPQIRRPENLPRPFSQDETARLWKLELPSDEALLRALLFFTGLRVSAVCAIRIGDVSEHPPVIRTVTKGGKTVLKPMHPKLEGAVTQYVLARTDLKPQTPLLAQKNGKPLRRKTVEAITKRWGDAARVGACLPHRFRHTFATEQLRGGSDIRAIQQTLDHRDLKSTAIYVKVHDEQVRSSILKLPEAWG